MAAGTWTDFRDAAIAGDIQHIKTHHSRKDFRLFLNQDQSALDLAARHGHIELVDFFLDSLSEFTRDDNEWRRIVNSALRNACKGAQEAMVRCLIRKLVDSENRQVKQEEIVLEVNEDRSSPYLGIYLPAVMCNNITVLKLILDYFGSLVRTDIDDEARSRIMVAAFGAGDKEILSTVMEDLKLEIGELSIDGFYADCAMGNAEKVLRGIDNHDESCREWYEKADVADSGNVDFVYGLTMGKLVYNKPFRLGMSPVGVAARFGHLQLVKDLLLRIESKGSVEGLSYNPVFTQTVDEVLLQAWSTDRLEIVQWLHESNRIKLQPPFRYNGINAFGKNRVFDYVSSICPSLDGLFDKPKPAEGEGEDIVPVVNNILDLLSERSIPVIEYYIEASGEDAFSSLREHADRLAPLCVVDDCSLFLTKLKPFMSPFTHPYTDDDSWRIFFDYSGMELPCLPILETLLELSSVSCEGGCLCGREMFQFMAFGNIDYLGMSDYDYLPYDLVYNTVSAAMALMLRKQTDLHRFPLSELFSLALQTARSGNSQILTRLLCFLDYVDVSSMIKFCMSTEMFVNLSELENKEKLDAIYRNLLRGLAGCESPPPVGFTFPRLLYHTLSLSEHLRDTYFNLIRSFGFRITDIWVIFDREIRQNNRSFYEEASSFSNPPVPTLKNMVRIQIYRRLREDQTRLRANGQGLSFQEMVENFVSDPEIKSLPDPLPNFLRLPPMVYIKTGT